MDDDASDQDNGLLARLNALKQSSVSLNLSEYDPNAVPICIVPKPES